jgi:putative spermidine/putrescine transport system permease protein
VDLLLLAPGLGYLLVFMCVPLIQVVLRSVGLLAFGEPSRFTLAFFREIAENNLYRNSVLFSLYFALVTTGISLILALFTSAVLQIRFPGRTIAGVLYKIPLVVPSLVAAFLVLTLIDQGGILARILARYGADWPELVHDRWGLGIIMVLVWHNVPIMIVILSAVMSAIPADVTSAARNLGATPWQVFVNITVPLSLPGISASSLLVFIGVFGAFSIPSLLGAPYPRAVAVVMSNEMLERANWGLTSALGTLVTVTSAIVLYAYYRLIRRQEAALR